jgi:5-methylcytosine-specific restriction endonuclease McrBC GTP-binding regulatory subunit McrB
MEQKFKKWLGGQKTRWGNYFSEPLISNLCKDLRETIPHWGQVNHPDLFTIKDVNIIQGLYERCLQDGDLAELNKSVESMRPSNALGRYKEFLDKVDKKFLESAELLNQGSKNIDELKISKNQILYGPPGTGKTYSTVGKSLEILGASNRTNIKSIRKLKEKFGSQVEFVTFHQSFSYEDFVEGLKANSDHGNISYDIENGVFKEICENAKNNLKKPYVLIIDEINRGNISRIFGELITLIEPSKRAGADEEISLKLPYSKVNFSVPDNLYIIGTMNTTDRSLTMMDAALRRRFDFVEMLPDVDLVKGNFDGINVKEILKTINWRIEVLYDKEHLIGHSFLMYVDNIQELKKAFKNKILPLLEEYFYNDFKKINLVLGSDSFYTKETKTLGEFNKDIYQKQDTEGLDSEAFINIYAK